MKRLQMLPVDPLDVICPWISSAEAKIEMFWPNFLPKKVWEIHDTQIRMYATLGCFISYRAPADEIARVGPKVLPNVLLYYEGTSSL